MSGNRGFSLQERDRGIVRAAAAMRVIDRNQATLIGNFGSIGRTNARLLGLVRAGLLRRFFLGSGGGRKAVYAVSPKGAQLVGLPCRGPRRPQGALLTVDNFIQHQLAVNDIHCGIAYRPIPVPEVTFVRWRDFYEPPFPGIGLIPDGYVELRNTTSIIPCFLEVDLGHESLAIWKGKVTNYLSLARSDEFSKFFGHQAFGVLVIANTERRLRSIRHTVSLVTDSVFRFGTLEAVRNGFFDAVWCKANDETKKSLLGPSL